MTFLDFWNDNDVTTLRLVTVGIPGGLTLTHDTETDDAEAYCDLGDWVSENEWMHDLTGTAVDGQWGWDGEGNPTYLTNSVLSAKASS